MTPAFAEALEAALAFEADRAIDNASICVPMSEKLCCTPGDVESAFDRGAHFARNYTLTQDPVVRGMAEACNEMRLAYIDHMKTKFTSDGSHFQADVRLNEAAGSLGLALAAYQAAKGET
jgi:hypothetical protein